MVTEFHTGRETPVILEWRGQRCPINKAIQTEQSPKRGRIREVTLNRSARPNTVT